MIKLSVVSQLVKLGKFEGRKVTKAPKIYNLVWSDFPKKFSINLKKLGEKIFAPVMVLFKSVLIQLQLQINYSAFCANIREQLGTSGV